MKTKIARKLEDFDITLHNNALNEDNYEDYYVTTTVGRGRRPDL